MSEQVSNKVLQQGKKQCFFFLFFLERNEYFFAFGALALTLSFLLMVKGRRRLRGESAAMIVLSDG